jgi:hypothetical protein
VRDDDNGGDDVSDANSEDSNGDWETCSSSDSDDDISGYGDEPVYDLLCRQCQALLSSRSMKVLLVANYSNELYSTDIPSDSITTGAPVPIDTCACVAQQSLCTSCRYVVGYHVLLPCSDCGTQDHNSHFWLFHAGAVSPRVQDDVTWSQLSYNGSPRPDLVSTAPPPPPPAVHDSDSGDDNNGSSTGAQGEVITSHVSATAPAADEYDEDCCCICAASPMFQPTQVSSCGHCFCFGCISREVDARRACPLDRLEVTRDMLRPAGGVDTCIDIDVDGSRKCDGDGEDEGDGDDDESGVCVVDASDIIVAGAVNESNNESS